MTTRMFDRLKRSLFREKEVMPELERVAQGEVSLEAELEEEEEPISERLSGTLRLQHAEGGASGESPESDPDSDYTESEWTDSTDLSPVGTSPSGSASSLLNDSWRSPAPSSANQTFEVTDASIVHDGSSKFVLYTINVLQSATDRSPAVITRRYSDFRHLHRTLRRLHGNQMEGVCFPRKRLHRNYTAETIAKRSRAFEQYLCHVCSLPSLKEALCVRHFFYLSDLQSAQVLIRIGQFSDALPFLLNAKSLQLKLGWACCCDNQTWPSSHWLFTLIGLTCCFQEAELPEEAWSHCDHALQGLVANQREVQLRTVSHEDKPLPEEVRPHPLLLPLLQAGVRLAWQTGMDKRQWEELLHHLEVEPDNNPTMKEFLVKHELLEED
ncbi:sorting nexin-21 [Gouania willdenowi]|uniref:Sorting nexin-21-like n=1 Tax=Gouania willdenowi TaxID=441366 RepID=A0A8C5EH15_GOUWI|nr:sorting nexin-21-like [Gouania willdenowi]